MIKADDIIKQVFAGGSSGDSGGGSGGGGGESGTMVVTYTADPDTMEITACDKTFSEIWAAVNSGAIVYANMVEEGSPIEEYSLCPLTQANYGDEDGYIYGGLIFGRASAWTESGVYNVAYMSITHSLEDTEEAYHANFITTPIINGPTPS